MDISKYDEKGMTGLVNLGNTCYINSFIQILNHTYELHDIFETNFRKNTINNKIPESVIFNEWFRLKNMMFSSNGVVSPNRFIQNLREVAINTDNENFSGETQNDMVEFFHFVIECMHKSISRKINIKISGKDGNDTDRLAIKCYTVLRDVYSREYSDIMKLYYGMYISVITSYPSNIVYSHKPEMYSTVDLPIPTNVVNIYDCFDEFIKPELLTGDNAWFNEKTGLKESVCKRMTFWDFPNILIISLKRFSPCGTSKNNISIDFPIDSLNLSKYVSGYNADKYSYELFGVCNHIGNISHGHYTTFARNSTNNWNHFNDNIVENVVNVDDIITPWAYCLFYRRK